LEAHPVHGLHRPPARLRETGGGTRPHSNPCQVAVRVEFAPSTFEVPVAPDALWTSRAAVAEPCGGTGTCQDWCIISVPAAADWTIPSCGCSIPPTASDRVKGWLKSPAPAITRHMAACRTQEPCRSRVSWTRPESVAATGTTAVPLANRTRGV